MEHKPDIDQLRQARPGLVGLEFLREGGFKAVYKAEIQGRLEAVKVIYIPPEAEGDGTRKEINARVKREIDALGQCRTNRLVTLGSLALEPISVGGHDYLIYSEELLPGESLRQRLRTRPDYRGLWVLTQCLMEALQ